MKKILTTGILLMLVVSNSIAQNCKMVKETKDAFSNKVEKTARVTLGAAIYGTKWAVEFIQDDKETIMKWNIAMQGEYNDIIARGTKLLLKLKDGTVTSFETVEDSKPVTQAVNAGAGAISVFSVYILKFNLTQENLEMLSKSTIEEYKVDAAGMRIVNPKEKEKQVKEFQDVCGCLLDR